MLDTKEIKYSYNDIMVKPAVVSDISSRKECNPYDEYGMLPIFAAPMTAVIDEDNYGLFEDNHIYPILPRNHDLETRVIYALKGRWAAFSLSEFINLFCDKENFDYGVNTVKVLIDIANGHMKKLYDAVKTAKSLYGDKIEIMVGNIANPETYRVAYEACADYIRVGIGGGSGCVTASNTGIYMSLASLVNEIYLIKKELSFSANYNGKKLPKIVADGGIRGFSDVIKALALGADYVMCGGILSSLIESAGKMFTYDKGNNLINLTDERKYIIEQDGIFCYDNGHEEDVKLYDTLYKRFYGMASRQGQIDINGEKTKTSEGIERIIPVTTNLDKWVDNMQSYLRSAMSYCNVKDLKDFNPENVDTIVISNNAKNSINK